MKLHQDPLEKYTFIELNLAPAEYRALRQMMAAEALQAQGHPEAVIAGLLGMNLEKLRAQSWQCEVIPGRRLEIRYIKEKKCGETVYRGRISMAIAPPPAALDATETLMSELGLSRREAKAMLTKPDSGAQPPPPPAPSNS